MAVYFENKIFSRILHSIFLVGLVSISVIACNRNELTTSDEWKEEAPVEVEKAARHGLLPFLNAIPENELTHYNFSDKEEFNQASLGRPLRVYTIKPEEIINYKNNKSILEIISPTSIWLFPVIFEGEFRVLLTIDFIDNSWIATTIGSSGLAAQLYTVFNKWPSSKAYKHIFVRVFQATSEFIILLHSGSIEIRPLNSAMISLKLEKEKMLDLSDVISKLKQRNGGKL
jgi:hypothetical protein